MTDNDDQPTGRLPGGISRRTLAAGAAWSIPVIAVASAAPAYAVSGGVVTFKGDGCKHPGNSQPPFFQDYHFVLNVKNTTGSDVTLCITKMELNGAAKDFSMGAGVVPVNSNTKCVTVPSSAGSAGIDYIVHSDGDNSANANMEVFYTYGSVADSATHQLSGDPCTFACPNNSCP